MPIFSNLVRVQKTSLFDIWHQCYSWPDIEAWGQVRRHVSLMITLFDTSSCSEERDVSKTSHTRASHDMTCSEGIVPRIAQQAKF
jgi:hypothetical protein